MCAHPFGGRSTFPRRRTRSAAEELLVASLVFFVLVAAVVLAIAPHLMTLTLPEAIADLRHACFGR